MAKRKTVSELEEEYKRAEERAKQMQEKLKRATAAEEAKKKGELLRATLAWIESYDQLNGIDDAIRWFNDHTAANEKRKQ